MRLGCIFVVDNPPMKRALYFLLMVWIALQSALVQAHVVAEDLHPLMHAAHLADHSASEADSDEPCDMVVCGHPVGASSMGYGLVFAAQPFLAPMRVMHLSSLALLDDIERPKWPTTAPGVAGI